MQDHKSHVKLSLQYAFLFNDMTFGVFFTFIKIAFLVYSTASRILESIIFLDWGKWTSKPMSWPMVAMLVYHELFSNEV